MLGMPRILLTARSITRTILKALDVEHTEPTLAAGTPQLPKPFYLTAERIKLLENTDLKKLKDEFVRGYEQSSQKAFCQTERSIRALN